MRHARGNNISMIFQEPMTALNPLHVVVTQIGEVLSLHKKMTAGQARSRVLELLHLVGIQEPEKRLKSYPHQLSGGQRQRVMIAMALANEPDILIADEPTTALDVTIQAQILDLLKELQTKLGMGMILGGCHDRWRDRGTSSHGRSISPSATSLHDAFAEIRT